MRTSSRRDAEDLGDVVAVHIGRLGAGLDFDAVADAAREAGLRLDIGVLDEAGLELALDDDVGGGQTRLDIAARDPPARQDVAGPVRMDARRAGRERGLERSSAPAARRHVTGNSARSSARIAGVFADDQRDRLAAEAARPSRQAPAGRRTAAMTAEAIDAGHVPGGEDRGDRRDALRR